MGNAVIHFELMSKDPARLSTFYAKVFDWKIQDMPQISYRIVDTGAQGEMKGINGGIVKPDKPEPWPGNMTMYILVDDLVAYRKKVTAAGGRILIEEQDVQGMGSFSLFADPEGRMIGLWKAKAGGRKPTRAAAIAARCASRPASTSPRASPSAIARSASRAGHGWRSSRLPISI
jgi:predicted enzyme related to lactoylglutathione lyase